MMSSSFDPTQGPRTIAMGPRPTRARPAPRRMASQAALPERADRPAGRRSRRILVGFLEHIDHVLPRLGLPQEAARSARPSGVARYSPGP